MRKTNRILILFLLIFKVFAVSAQPILSILSYNVENLFDTVDDPNKQDETYLPLRLKMNSKELKNKCQTLKNFKYRHDCLTLNWTPRILDKKIKNLSQKILEFGRPDIVILDEVENINVLSKLNSALNGKKFKNKILLEGDDPRGIDVALLTDLDVKEAPVLIPIEDTHSIFREPLKTRGILKVILKLGKRNLTVFGVHLPSQASPVEVRKKIIDHLSELVSRETNLWVVAGDWNVTRKEDDESGLIESAFSEKGLLPHKTSCEGCKGSYFYKGEWSFLDMIILDRRFLKNGYQLKSNSMHVLNRNFFLGPEKKPHRFDWIKEEGASDHWPIKIDLF